MLLKRNPLSNHFWAIVLLLGSVLSSCGTTTTSSTSKPNVIIILADDLGYGDISANQIDPKISTPAIDGLVNQGMHFDNAHTASSVCTPSRYALLTGRYSWRTKLRSGVLFGYDQPLITERDYTIGQLFQDAGYRTSAIGKWHLGLPWSINSASDYVSRTKDSIVHKLLAKENDMDIAEPFTELNWHKNIGFDYFYGISASLDIPPYGMIENGQYLAPINSRVEASEHQASYDRDYWREGPATEGFDHGKVLKDITKKSVEFVEKNSENPFFMYMALTAPHTPWLPSEEFRGKSNAGKYGDFLAMVDWSVGQVLEALERKGLSDNTIVIFTSDNGAHEKAIEEFGGSGHRPNVNFRGQKGDLYEGGHHVPLVIKWSGYVPEGVRSSQLVVLTDLMRTVADMVGVAMPEGAGEDSKSFYSVVSGENKRSERVSAIYHSQIGTFAVQHEDWKLIEHLGSGGFTQPRYVVSTSDKPPRQLFNLESDISETQDLVLQQTDKVNELQKILDEARSGLDYSPRK